MLKFLALVTEIPKHFASVMVFELSVFIFSCFINREQRDDICHVNEVLMSSWLITGRINVNGLIVRSK